MFRERRVSDTSDCRVGCTSDEDDVIRFALAVGPLAVLPGVVCLLAPECLSSQGAGEAWRVDCQNEV